MNINRAIALACELQNKGEIDQAEYIYKEIIKIQPDNVSACYNLGIIFQDKGQPDEAIFYYKKALDLDANLADANFNIGLLLHSKGLFDNAIKNYQKALGLDPNSADINNNLGNVLKDKGQIEEALAYYKKAIQLDPNYDKAYNNLGIALVEKGDLEEAIRYFHKALWINPNFFDAFSNIGNVLNKKGRFEEAIGYFHKALQINPDFAGAYNNLGVLLLEREQFDKAIICLQKAIKINPNFIAAYNNLGMNFHRQGQLNQAMFYYQKAIDIDPNYSVSYNYMGNALKDKGYLNKAEVFYRRAMQLKPDDYISYEALLMNMNYNAQYDAQTVFCEHARFAKQFAEPLYPRISSFDNVRITTRRLKIGYVSPDFKKHSVAYFIEPVLSTHDKEGFEIFCYSDVLVPDEKTGLIQKYAHQWRNIVGLSDTQVSDLIHKDGIDILIDLAGHTACNRLLLFARKPAPVQVSWIGYSATTGLLTMDYKIVDNYTDPPGMTDQYYSEKLIHLPKSFLCYLPNKNSPKVGELPIFTIKRITFGSFNNLSKVSPEIINIWVEILKSLPNPHLIMKAKSFADSTTRQEVMAIFEQKGISAEHIELLSWVPNEREHLQLYNRIDIGLDTFPYNGTTTTCEAMWMGVPVISLCGNTHASRVGASLLSNVGIPELVARTSDEYVSIAINLAKDLQRLKSLREHLRDMMTYSALCDAKRFAFNLELCYRKIWETWCKSV
jgi:protein O-GlcNAc transferase